MKQFAISILLVATLFLIAMQIPISFCSTPITYKVGSIDPRFELSSDQAIADIQQSLTILGTYKGNPLFVHNQDAGTISVNFRYDARTQLDTTIDSKSKQLDSQSASLSKQQADYEANVRVYNQKVNDFEHTVEQYASQGGISQETYDRLQQTQRDLDAQANSLRATEQQLRKAIQGYNSNVNIVNSDISSLKEKIAVKPEEGLYNGETNSIDIYFIRDKPELFHTVAHEFGHAIGMEHVDDPQAIMYPSVSRTTQMTASDRSELDAICTPLPFPVYAVHVLKQSLERLIISTQTQVKQQQ